MVDQKQVKKTVILYDTFFRAKNQKDIITHEMAHIAVWDLSAAEAEEFAKLSGWLLDLRRKRRAPPLHPLKPDSVESVSEDFANHVEIYHSNPGQLKKHNPRAFDFIDKVIKQKGMP